MTKGYKGTITEVASEVSGFKNKCESLNILKKLTEIEILEENFNVLNSRSPKYFYKKSNDKLFKIDCETFQPSYYLNYLNKNTEIEFVSIFDNEGSSINNELQKIIKD